MSRLCLVIPALVLVLRDMDWLELTRPIGIAMRVLLLIGFGAMATEWVSRRRARRSA